VTLTASAAAGSTFAGWSGACAGTGACQVTMSAAASVTASFALPAGSSTLTVVRTGNGTGAVASCPSDIICGPACSATYGPGAAVLLTAVASADSTFLGWSGACAGT